MPRVHGSQRDKDAKPSRTDLAPDSAKHTRSGPSTLGGLGDKGRGTRRTRTAPDYLHSAAQTEPWPRPGRRRSTRKVPQQKAATQVSEAATKQTARTLPETARAAAPASELRHGRGGAEAEGLRAVWGQEVVLLTKSHKHWPTCSDPWLTNRFLLLFWFGFRLGFFLCSGSPGTRTVERGDLELTEICLPGLRNECSD